MKNVITFHDVSDDDGDSIEFDFKSDGSLIVMAMEGDDSKFVVVALNESQQEKLRDVLVARDIKAPDEQKLWTER